MSNDLVINPHTARFCYGNQLPFNKHPQGIRSSSLRVTNQMSLSKMPSAFLVDAGCPSRRSPRIARTFLGAVRGSIRSSQKLIFFYSKLMMKMVEGGFDPDSFRLCAAVSLRSGRVASSHHCPLRRQESSKQAI
jgi:hypothetical protein